MKAVLIFFTLWLLGCSTDPRPLQYGSDLCFVCKMTLVDSKFGAEIVTTKGKLFVFDDLNCLLTFYHAGEVAPENLAHVQVVNYSQPGQLIDVHHALYLKSDQIRSPMSGGIAAFASETEYKRYNKEWNGILMSWGEVVTQFK